MADPEDIETDWEEAGRIADERLRRYRDWNYILQPDDDKWQAAISAAEEGKNELLIGAFMTLTMTRFAANALSDLFNRYRLQKLPNRPRGPLGEKFQMRYERAADFVKLQLARSKSADEVFAAAALKSGIEEHKLRSFLDGKQGKKMPAWTYETPEKK
jgi:hypothetical protein